jgi:hypothetical protein
MPLFAQPAAPHPALTALRAIDLTNTTPMQAFEHLRRLQADASP